MDQREVFAPLAAGRGSSCSTQEREGRNLTHGAPLVKTPPRPPAACRSSEPRLLRLCDALVQRHLIEIDAFHRCSPPYDLGGRLMRIN